MSIEVVAIGSEVVLIGSERVFSWFWENFVALESSVD